jgi:hypothetical protein
LTRRRGDAETDAEKTKEGQRRKECGDSGVTGGFARDTLGLASGLFRGVTAAGDLWVVARRIPAASDLVGIYEDVGAVLITLGTSSVPSFRFSTSVSNGPAIIAIRSSIGDCPFERKISPPVFSTKGTTAKLSRAYGLQKICVAVKLAELELARRQGEVVSIDTVVAAVGAHVTACRSRLLSLPRNSRPLSRLKTMPRSARKFSKRAFTRRSKNLATAASKRQVRRGLVASNRWQPVEVAGCSMLQHRKISFSSPFPTHGHDGPNPGSQAHRPRQMRTEVADYTLFVPVAART